MQAWSTQWAVVQTERQKEEVVCARQAGRSISKPAVALAFFGTTSPRLDRGWSEKETIVRKKIVQAWSAVQHCKIWDSSKVQSNPVPLSEILYVLIMGNFFSKLLNLNEEV